MKKTLLFLALIPTLGLSAQTPIFNSTMTVTGYGDVNSPSGEDVSKIIDGSTSTKFLDFNHADGTGFDVDLGGVSKVAESISVTTANDSPNRDPQNYEVFGSNNGVDYTSIGTGTISCIATRFSTRDFTFSNTTAYSFYRVNFTTQCGADNSIQVAEVQLFESDTLGVHENELNVEELSIVPNPNSGSFSINYSGNLAIGKAVITDVSGKLVKEIKFSPNALERKVQLESLKAGLYFVKVSNAKSTVAKKLIVR